LRGNFEALGRRDAGFYGKGMYFTLDLEYAMQYVSDDTQVVMVVAVMLGNVHPVTDLSRFGLALLTGADTHAVAVARDPQANRNPLEPFPSGVDPEASFLPVVHPDRWHLLDSQRGELFTELVKAENAQILPLAALTLSERSRSALP